MIKLKIQDQLDKIDKTTYWLAKQCNVSQNSMGKIVKGQTTSIKYDILEAICLALGCQIGDILEIVNEEQE